MNQRGSRIADYHEYCQSCIAAGSNFDTRSSLQSLEHNKHRFLNKCQGYVRRSVRACMWSAKFRESIDRSGLSSYVQEKGLSFKQNRGRRQKKQLHVFHEVLTAHQL